MRVLACILIIAGCNGVLDIHEPREASCGLSIQLTAANVSPTGRLTYRTVIANNGQIAVESILATLTLPEGGLLVSALPASCAGSGTVLSCDVRRLEAFDSEFFELQVDVPPQGASIVAGGEVVGTLLGGRECRQTTTSSTMGSTAADVTLALSHAPDPALLAEPVTYTVDVGNRGPSSAADVRVQLTSTMLAIATTGGNGWSCIGTSCALGAPLPAGEGRQLTVVATPLAIFGVSLKAAATTSTQDLLTNNNVAVSNTTVAGVADLLLTIQDTPDPATTNGSLSYIITVQNNGPNDAVGISVTDTLPAGYVYDSFAGEPGWTCTAASGTVTCTRVSIPSGASSTVTLAGHLIAASGTLTNTATVTANSVDKVSANNTATATTQVGP